MTDLQEKPTKTRSLADFASSVTPLGMPPE
ncbi:MAG: hypothetical protein QOF15_4511, partial [Mycobacterium sp.]|nr:hypothetical protein [Mycobacterium sp.]